MLKISKKMQTVYLPRADRADRLASAVSIAEFAVTNDGLHTLHRNELLSLAAWKATEADGKYNTRFRSAGVLDGPLGTAVNHEHVLTRLQLREMLSKNPDRCDDLLRLAPACLVTIDEHNSMSDRAFGWDRYRTAAVGVVDMRDRSDVNLFLAQKDLLTSLAQIGMSI